MDMPVVTAAVEEETKKAGAERYDEGKEKEDITHLTFNEVNGISCRHLYFSFSTTNFSEESTFSSQA